MIPSDLAARLRMLTEASFFETDQPVYGTTRAREVQGRLPELAPGERFTAMVQRPLPDGTFQALVAGRSYTLALNHPASAGDTLELVVMQNTPRAVVAQLANPVAAGAAAAASPGPDLSATGRLISFLLTGQPASQPAALAAGRPLVDAPPANEGASTLAPVLREALTRSGLFYESHQMQWLSGRIDTAALRQEPQGQQPPSGQPSAEAAAEAATVPGGAPPAARAGTETAALRAAGPAANAPATAAETTLAAVEPGEEAGPTTLVQPGASRAQPQAVPDRLIPIVHQQLDAMATQNYVWHGQVWPGQTVEWEIEDPQRDRRDGDDEAPPHWNTTLRLSLPRLGGVEARLVLSPAGVAMRLLADDPDTVAALDAGRARLDGALSAANLPLTGFVAERRDGR